MHTPPPTAPSLTEIMTALPPSTQALAGRYAGAAADTLLERLGALARVILTANQVMNLTGDSAPERFWERHLEDALAAAEQIEAALGARPGTGDAVRTVLDVGTGGGIPGLAWAIFWPEANVTLLESRAKRARFLEEAARELGLTNVAVHAERAEGLGQSPAHRERYDLVTARALAELPTLLEWTLPFTRPGGHVAAVKSAPLDAELAAAGLALETLGAAGAPPRLLPYTRGDGKACLVCLVAKNQPTPPLYPRPANLPERRPLVAGSPIRQESRTL